MDNAIDIPDGFIEDNFVFGEIDGVKTLCCYTGNGGEITLPESCKGKEYVIKKTLDNLCLVFLLFKNKTTGYASEK